MSTTDKDAATESVDDVLRKNLLYTGHSPLTRQGFIVASSAIRDLRSRVAELEKALETISRTTFSGSEMGDEYLRGNRDAHEKCAGLARSALGAKQS